MMRLCYGSRETSAVAHLLKSFFFLSSIFANKPFVFLRFFQSMRQPIIVLSMIQRLFSYASISNRRLLHMALKKISFAVSFCTVLSFGPLAHPRSANGAATQTPLRDPHRQLIPHPTARSDAQRTSEGGVARIY